MDEGQATKLLQSLLGKAGVRPGMVLHLTVDMSRVPLPDYPAALSREAIRVREQKWCAFLWQGIGKVLGSAGTLLVHTFTYAYAGGTPFVLEETPSESGPFTEFIRTRPEAIRSLHPIFSMAGIGPQAASILENTGRSAFGPTSPFGRLADQECYFLSLGTTVGASMTYLHHMEQQVGVNHRYNKAFNSAIQSHGKIFPGPWLANLRYLGVGVWPALPKGEEALRQAGVLLEVEVGGFQAQGVAYGDVNQVGYALLAQNPCAFAAQDFVVELDEAQVSEAPAIAERIRFCLLPADADKGEV